MLSGSHMNSWKYLHKENELKMTYDARRMINTQISYLLICGVSLPILEIHYWPEF